MKRVFFGIFILLLFVSCSNKTTDYGNISFNLNNLNNIFPEKIQRDESTESTDSQSKYSILVSCSGDYSYSETLNGTKEELGSKKVIIDSIPIGSSITVKMEIYNNDKILLYEGSSSIVKIKRGDNLVKISMREIITNDILILVKPPVINGAYILNEEPPFDLANKRLLSINETENETDSVKSLKLSFSVESEITPTTIEWYVNDELIENESSKNLIIDALTTSYLYTDYSIQYGETSTNESTNDETSSEVVETSNNTIKAIVTYNTSNDKIIHSVLFNFKFKLVKNLIKQ